MVKLLALYKPPTDVETFESVYFGRHMPDVKKIPGLRRIEFNRVIGAPVGDPVYYLATSLYFDNAEAMEAGLASQEGRTATRSLRDLGSEATILLADVDTEDL
jgi:uncharacterized protein (TIGR02118 family)